MKNNFNFSQPKYSNANKIAKDFKQSYLNSLQIILDDDKFKEKAETLPLLKSSVINKYEKMLEKKKEKLKLQNKKYNITNKTEHNTHEIKNDKVKKITGIGNNSKKIIHMRYIILDKQLTEISLKSIEENTEINNKLTDPFNSFFQESNQKIRKNAIEQILNNIFVVEEDENKEDILPDISNNNKVNLELNTDKKKDIFYKDLEAFENKYQLNIETEEKNQEKYVKTINEFEEKCQNYDIVTLGQKIDFFSYLYNENLKKKQKMIPSNKTRKKTTINMSKINSSHSPSPSVPYSNYNSPKRSDKKINNFYSNFPSVLKKSIPLLKRKSTLKLNQKILEGRYIYYSEIKTIYKISEDIINNKLKIFEKYERELNNKIKNFKLVKYNLEISSKLIDKLKLYLLIYEISQERIILRECNITPENFLFLLYKNYFDFSTLKHINLTNNNLGDIGGSYLLHLISKFSIDIEYINISYTLIGKNSCKILIDSLSNNIMKIKYLNIGGNNLRDELFSEILVAISSNNYLSKLFIYDNNLGRISSAIIGNFLKYDKKLTLLDVSKNNFDDEIIVFLLKGLIINATLDILILNELNLTNKSFRAFDTTLSINTNLKKIFLEKNKFNYKAIQKLSDILNSNKYLEYISLVGNNFEYDHIKYANEQQRLIKLRVISKSEYFNQIGITEDKNAIYDYIQ